MTNFEKLKLMDEKELSRFICTKIPCIACFAFQDCQKGNNGILQWLKKEEDDELDKH